MTGFRGQKFDFVGEDSEWYCVLDDGPGLHLNMRVTSPVPSVPEITYITGISLIAADADGVEHTIVIEVTNPYSLESSCPEGVSPCLADGALSVHVDGSEVLLAPGTVSVGPDLAVSATNLPGACRYHNAFCHVPEGGEYCFQYSFALPRVQKLRGWGISMLHLYALAKISSGR